MHAEYQTKSSLYVARLERATVFEQHARKLTPVVDFRDGPAQVRLAQRLQGRGQRNARWARIGLMAQIAHKVRVGNFGSSANVVVE